MTTWLVVDANIAISAGESEHPISSRCRRFLEEVIKGDFLVPITEEIANEWKDPEKPRLTGNSRRWLARLWGERKAKWIDDVFDTELREAIDALDDTHFTAKMRLRMLEDVHLLEAAIATDRNIISQDEEARKLFKRALPSMKKARIIIWMNPVTEEDGIAWIENDCPVEKHRQLGYVE